MFKCDYHTHTYFSFDGDSSSSPNALCESAIAHGVTDLAITDHFESNRIIDNASIPYPADAAYEAILSAKEKYKDRLNITYGIEIGQANQCPEEARRLLQAYDFEFIIASIHNLRGSPDFYYYDFSKINRQEYISNLFERNITELCETIDSLERIDTIAHLTYMRRYMSEAGKAYDFSSHSESLEKIFKKMVKKDIALEVNVSTLWRGSGFSMPDAEILSLYKDCQGRYITVGTDSHSPQHIGECVEDAFCLLKSVGLHDIVVVRNGEKTIVKI